MKVSVYSWGLGISVSSPNLIKSNIGWPQQPPSERISYISEILDFWWSIPKKMFSIGHFGASDDRTIRIRTFFKEIGQLRPLRLQRPPRSMRLQRFVRPGKSLIRTSESSRFLNSIIWGLISLYFNCFEKKIFWQNHKTSCWNLAPFLS